MKRSILKQNVVLAATPRRGSLLYGILVLLTMVPAAYGASVFISGWPATSVTNSTASAAFATALETGTYAVPAAPDELEARYRMRTVSNTSALRSTSLPLFISFR